MCQYQRLCNRMRKPAFFPLPLSPAVHRTGDLCNAFCRALGKMSDQNLLISWSLKGRTLMTTLMLSEEV